jgi:hypothetical protein
MYSICVVSGIHPFVVLVTRVSLDLVQRDQRQSEPCKAGLRVRQSEAWTCSCAVVTTSNIDQVWRVFDDAICEANVGCTTRGPSTALSTRVQR